MPRLWALPFFVTALLVAPRAVHADPPAARTFASLLATPGMCVPGVQVPCSCPGGARGSQVCEAPGFRFSLCACASVNVNVPNVVVPTVPQVDLHWNRPHHPSHRSSGLGMLIGGGVALLVGTGNLVWGLERLRDTREDPLGIVMIATGGAAMVTGLPLTIVGIAFLATRGLHPQDARSPFQIAPTASGMALLF